MAFIFRPKKPVWFVASTVIMIAGVLVYAVAAWWSPWRAGRAGGLTFGTIAAVIFLLDGLYPLRRRLLSWPLGTAQRWLQFHIYGGVIAMLFVLIHAGFAWPRGTMGWWLLFLSAWTTGTGLFGVALQKWIPSVIAGTLRVEALQARVPELTARLAKAADELMRAGPASLWAAYEAEIRPALERPEPAWAHVANVQAACARFTKPLERLGRTSADAERVDALRAIVSEKAELDVHLSLQRVLRGWLLLHVPPAIVLLGLLAVHIFAALYL